MRAAFIEVEGTENGCTTSMIFSLQGDQLED